MAGVASCAQISGMRIVIAVAACTGNIVVSERVPDMTTIALVGRVCAQQRKFCQVVVEKHRVLPLRLRVTAFAASAEKTLVRIFSAMTSVA